MKGGHCAPILTECLGECEITKTFMESNTNRDCLYICAFSMQRLHLFFSQSLERVSFILCLKVHSLRCKSLV